MEIHLMARPGAGGRAMSVAGKISYGCCRAEFAMLIRFTGRNQDVRLFRAFRQPFACTVLLLFRLRHSLNPTLHGLAYEILTNLRLS